MRIIFVGIHNKPGKRALCPSTRSGQTISMVCDKLKVIIKADMIRVNLFDMDEMPLVCQTEDLRLDFLQRMEMKDDDLFVLLGAVVRYHIADMLKALGHDYVALPHPSMQYANFTREKYVENAVRKISHRIIKVK